MPVSSEGPRKTRPPAYVLQERGHSILQIILGNLLPSISSRILLTRILKGKINSPLQRLNPPYSPGRHHRSTSNLVFCLQNFNLPKEKVDLVRSTSLGIPTQSLHRGTRSAKREGRGKVSNIEPRLLPVDDLITQLIRNILWFLPLTKLQLSTPNYIYHGIIGMGFQMEEKLK